MLKIIITIAIVALIYAPIAYWIEKWLKPTLADFLRRIL